MHKFTSKRKRKCVKCWYTLYGDSLLRTVIISKGREANKRMTKTDDGVLDAGRCMWKNLRRPAPRGVTTFFSLPRNQRFGRRTDKLEIQFHTELMTRKEEQ